MEIFLLDLNQWNLPKKYCKNIDTNAKFVSILFEDIWNCIELRVFFLTKGKQSPDSSRDKKIISYIQLAIE